MLMPSRSLRSSVLFQPTQITPQGQIMVDISKRRMTDHGFCLLHLKANISLSPPLLHHPSSSSFSSSSTAAASSISVHFKLEDRTKVITSPPQTKNYYRVFDCPDRASKPFECTLTTEATAFRPLKIETSNIYPVKRGDLAFFELVLNSYITKISSYLGIRGMDIEATAFIGRVIRYNEGMDIRIMRDIEDGGVKKGSSEVGDEYSDCAVCLEVARMNWFDVMRLPCLHV